jgi:hypothetical protein
MAREARLWQWLREGWRGTPLLDVRRVENLVGEGDADVQGCHDSRYFELELKGVDRPARPDTPLAIEVRPAQPVRHRLRWRAGGNVWLYVRVGVGRDVRRYLLPGALTARVREGVTEQWLASRSVLPPVHSPADVLRRATYRDGTEPIE